MITDIKMLCDSHVTISCIKAIIVVVLIAMREEGWLAWSLETFTHCFLTGGFE